MTVCGNKVYITLSDSAPETSLPLIAFAEILVPNKLVGISTEPLRNTTLFIGVSTSHPVFFFTSVTFPFANGIITLSPPFSVAGVTLILPFCHWPTVGAVGFSSFTATYTFTCVPSLPWLSTAAKVTSYNPAGVIPVSFVVGICEIILTFPVPNGLFSSNVTLSSASVTVTKSFNKSAVNVVPES